MAFSTAKPPRTGQGSLWHSDKQDTKITTLVSMMLIVSNKCGKSAARLFFFVIGVRNAKKYSKMIERLKENAYICGIE